MSKTETPALPVHVGLILDGNRRWARSNNLPQLEGHRTGYNNLKDIAKHAADQGIKYLSAFIFSTENWNRSKEEVTYLMNLAYTLLTRDVRELNKENIRVLWLGSRERVSKKLQSAIDKAVESTKNNTRGTLCLCFNYGGQQEIVEAAQQLSAQGIEITHDNFQAALYAPEVPAVDLLIRTSGEYRTSGYMLWRAAYAELYFTDKFWPEFNRQDFNDALEDYTERQRRFGT
jgi:undecaprenyl diphosphate synthase